MAVDFKAIFSAQDKVSNTLKGINSQGNTLTKTMGRLATAAAGVFSVGKVISFGKESVTALTTFEKSMSEVYTLLPQASEKALGEMSDHAKQFSKDMGIPTTETIPALYEALSSGVPQDTVFDFLEVANKAAIGGVTTLETTVNGLTSVINAYGSDVINAGEASDLMFEAVKLGKTTFEELSNSLFNVNPIAASLGINFGDITAALAAMTAQGVPTSVATTQMRQALVELSKTGTDTDKIFRKVSGKGFKDFIKSGGNVQEAFQLLEKYAKDTGVGVNDLFGSVEAGSAVLSLTGKGTELFTQAMEAMEESTGSTNAAFETMDQSFSRKLDKLKSKFEVMKLEVGDKLLDAATPIFDYVSNNMDKITGGIETFFGYIAKGISTVGPMLPNILSSITGSVKNLWSVVSPVLSWMVKHPDLMANAIAAIGGAIIAKNVIQGVSGLAKSFGSLAGILTNPFALAIGAVGAAIGLIAMEIHNSNKRLKKASLAAHFGEISLSVQDLEAVAQHIVRTDALGELENALTSFDQVSQYKSSIEDAIKEINKYNWMVSIGMKLTPEQIDSYKGAIETFISDTQSLITEQQYAVNLVLGIFTNDDTQGTEIRTAVDAFYANNYNEVAELGTKLQEKVNDAFSDGLLTVDETQVISDYMNQMASITQKIAGYEFEAKMDMLSIKASGTELTPESFMDLQKQLTAELEKAVTSYDEGLTLTISQYKMMLDEGAIDKTQYDEWVNTATQNYLDAVSGMELQAHNFQADTIMQAYSEELTAAFPELNALIQENMGKASTLFGPELDKFYKDLNKQAKGILDKGDMLAIQGLFELMKPSEEQLKQLAASYVEAGMLIPESLEEAILNSSSIGALTGNIDELKTVMGNALIEENGTYMPTEKFWNDSLSELEKSVIQSYPELRLFGTNAANEFIDSLSYAVSQPFEFSLKIRYSISGDPLGLFNKKTLPSKEWQIPMAMPGYASGTTNALDTYIAGEEGPELILGGGGSTVFPTSETDRIISAFENSSLNTKYNPLSSFDFSDKEMVIKKVIELAINGSGKISLEGMTKEQAMQFIRENIEKVIMEILDDEEFEEGRLAYEF